MTMVSAPLRPLAGRRGRRYFANRFNAPSHSRVGSRSGHLFPKSLVTSQFSALEPPLGEPGVVAVPAQAALEEQVDAVLKWLATTSDANPERSTA